MNQLSLNDEYAYRGNNHLIPLLILIAAFGGYFITQKGVSTCATNEYSASKIGDGKDLSKRIIYKVHQTDEMYHLAQTFDKMFERLETSFESEKQFTSDVSHELRTPTSVIISQCEYALSREE